MNIRSCRKQFIDSLRLFVKGGNGGAGHPKRGGIGGNGGNVYVKATNAFNLKKLKESFPAKRFVAGDGLASMQYRLRAPNGQDLIIQVPCGTAIINDAGIVIGDALVEGEKTIVAHGAEGGSPTNGFVGKIGESLNLNLVYKTISDIGLAGFPNAGKSSIFHALGRTVSDAPVISKRRLETLRPYSGAIEYADGRSISLVDLPALVNGSHLNHGLGNKFLQHIERAKIVALVVSIDGYTNRSRLHRTALENVFILNKELEVYDRALVEKPAVLIVNKVDTTRAESKFGDLRKSILNRDIPSTLSAVLRPDQSMQFLDILAVSARTNFGIEELKRRLRELLDNVAECRLAGIPVTAAQSAALDNQLGIFQSRLGEQDINLV